MSFKNWWAAEGRKLAEDAGWNVHIPQVQALAETSFHAGVEERAKHQESVVKLLKVFGTASVERATMQAQAMCDVQYAMAQEEKECNAVLDTAGVPKVYELPVEHKCDNPDCKSKLGHRLRGLVSERDELGAACQRAVEKMAELEVVEVGPSPKGGFEVVFQGEGVKLLSAVLAAPFLDGPAKNYLEWVVNHPETGPLVMTVQRQEGKTPATLKREAEEALAAAERDRDLYKKALLDLTDGQLGSSWKEVQGETGLPDERCQEIYELCKKGE